MKNRFTEMSSSFVYYNVKHILSQEIAIFHQKLDFKNAENLYTEKEMEFIWLLFLFFFVQSLLHTMLNIKLNWVKKFYKKMVVVCQKMQSNKNYYGQKKREFFKMASVMKETNRENSQDECVNMCVGISI